MYPTRIIPWPFKLKHSTAFTYFVFYFYFLYSHLWFREIRADGSIYEGGWDMGDFHGNGEFEYEDGSKEIGQWVKDKKQGEFECYDKRGTLTHRKIYEDGKEIKCEEVKQKIKRHK